MRQTAEKGRFTQSTAVNSLMVMGKLIITAIRKNHFINVMLLYLEVSGLTTIRYKPYEVALMRINAFPKGIFGAIPVELVLNRINIKAPTKPSIAPDALRKVIFSRINIAESIKTKIGEMVTITEELIGVDKLKPLKKKSIFTTIPKMVHANILGQSLRCIFSDFTNRLINQNKIAAPETLNMIKPKG